MIHITPINVTIESKPKKSKKLNKYIASITEMSQTKEWKDFINSQNKK